MKFTQEYFHGEKPLPPEYDCKDYGYIILDDYVDDDAFTMQEPCEDILQAYERAKAIAAYGASQLEEPHTARVALVIDGPWTGQRDWVEEVAFTFDPEALTWEKIGIKEWKAREGK